MDPLTVSAIASAAPSVFQTIVGGLQGIGARKRAKTKFKPFQIPQEVYDNVGLSKRMYDASTMYGMPGQGRTENKLLGVNSASNNMITQTQQSPASMLLGFASTDQNSKNAMADYGAKAAEFRFGNMNQAMSGLQSAKRVLAEYKAKQWMNNEYNPWLMAMQEAGALRNANIQNLYGGITSFSEAAGNYINRKDQKSA